MPRARDGPDIAIFGTLVAPRKTRDFWTVTFLAVLVVYGRVLLGLSPMQRGISWELRAFGFLAGAATAWLSGHRPRRRA